MIKPRKRASRLRSERGRSGSCGGSDRHTQSQPRKTLVPLVRTSDGPRRLILDSGLHSLCKCQMLLQDWQCAGYDSFNRPSLRSAPLGFEFLDDVLVALDHVLHVLRVKFGAADVLKTRHLLFRLLAGSARQLDTVFGGNGGELTLQSHVIQHHKTSKGPNGWGVR